MTVRLLLGISEFKQQRSINRSNFLRNATTSVIINPDRVKWQAWAWHDNLQRVRPQASAHSNKMVSCNESSNQMRQKYLVTIVNAMIKPM